MKPRGLQNKIPKPLQRFMQKRERYKEEMRALVQAGEYYEHALKIPTARGGMPFTDQESYGTRPNRMQGAGPLLRAGAASCRSKGRK